MPELGGLGHVLDQDTTNMAEVQRGLKATFSKTVPLASYQESRIRTSTKRRRHIWVDGKGQTARPCRHATRAVRGIKFGYWTIVTNPYRNVP